MEILHLNILKTAAYFDIFSYPVTMQEIRAFMTHPCEDDEEAEQFKQDEEVSHADYPVAMVHEKENMPTLKSSTRVAGVAGVVGNAI